MPAGDRPGAVGLRLVGVLDVDVERPRVLAEVDPGALGSRVLQRGEQLDVVGDAVRALVVLARDPDVAGDVVLDDEQLTVGAAGQVVRAVEAGGRRRAVLDRHVHSGSHERGEHLGLEVDRDDPVLGGVGDVERVADELDVLRTTEAGGVHVVRGLLGVHHGGRHVQRHPLVRSDAVGQDRRLLGVLLLVLGQVGQPEGVELAVGQVAAGGRHEAVDRTAVELVDDVHGALLVDADALVAHDADLRALLDAEDLRGVLGVEERLEQPATGRLLGEQQGAPGGPPQPVQPAVALVLDEDLGLAGPQVHHRQRAVAADLVRAVQVAPGVLAGLVERVHVGEVVDPWIDVQNGLVGDQPLGAGVRDDERFGPFGGLVGVGGA